MEGSAKGSAVMVSSALIAWKSQPSYRTKGKERANWIREGPVCAERANDSGGKARVICEKQGDAVEWTK